MSNDFVTPADPEWYLPPGGRQSFVSGAAFPDEKIAVVANVEGPDVDFNGLSRFYTKSNEGWAFSEIPEIIVDIQPLRNEIGNIIDGVLLLSLEGNLYKISRDLTEVVNIKDVVENYTEKTINGYFNTLRLVKNGWIICGSHGKLYSSIGWNWSQWRDVGAAFQAVNPPTHPTKPAATGNLSIYDINISEDDRILVCGCWQYRGAPALQAALLLEKDLETISVKTDLTQGYVYNLHSANSHVYMVGTDLAAVLDLTKNKIKFIKILDKVTYLDVVNYNGKVYLAQAKELSVLNQDGTVSLGNKEISNIEPIKFQVLNEKLWIFGYQGVGQYDGNIFSIVEFPSVQRQ